VVIDTKLNLMLMNYLIIALEVTMEHTRSKKRCTYCSSAESCRECLLQSMLIGH